MRPTALGGLGRLAALHEQVRVTPGGGVQVTCSGVERPGPPVEVRRAVLLDEAGTRLLLGGRGHPGGALVLLDGSDVPRLALLVLDWTPPGAADDATILRTSGVEALCRALGLPLEPAEPASWNPAALRRALHRPGARPRLPGRLALPLARTAVLLAAVVFLGAATSPGSRWNDVIGEAVGGVLALVAAVLALLVGVPSAVGRLALLRAERLGPPDAGLRGRGVVVPARPASPVPRRVLDHELRLTSEQLVLRRWGRYVVLPGPSEGGVTQAVLEPTALRLRADDGLLYSSLATQVWCGTPEARTALQCELTAAGLEVLESPVDAVAMLDLDELSPDGSYARRAERPENVGDLDVWSAEWAAAATFFAAWACYAPVDDGADWQLVPAVVLVIACAVLTLVLVLLELRRFRRLRRDLVLVQPGAGRVMSR